MLFLAVSQILFTFDWVNRNIFWSVVAICVRLRWLFRVHNLIEQQSLNVGDPYLYVVFILSFLIPGEKQIFT